MSGVVCAFIGASFGGLPSIGDPYEGGFFAGQINDGGTIYNLVVSPRASGDFTAAWKTSETLTGSSSVIDGPANTSLMDNASHPAAQACAALSIGGFSDWYKPAVNELEVVYRNLKPALNTNNTSYGANPNAVPPTSNYTSNDPTKTSVTAFQSNGSEKLDGTTYWTSTEDDASGGLTINFDDGAQFDHTKTRDFFRVRAVRRVLA